MSRQPRKTRRARGVALAGAALGAAAAVASTVFIPATVAAASSPQAPLIIQQPLAGMRDPDDQRARIADALAEAVTRHTDRMAAIDRAAREHATVAPTTGVFTSGFGPRWGAFHSGIDIAAPVYTPIYAVRSGVVEQAGAASGYGQWVTVRHDDGARSVYGHVETIDVAPGQRVIAGDKIAGMGNRGFSTGPHLHFEYMPDGVTPIDPLGWLRANGVWDW